MIEQRFHLVEHGLLHRPARLRRERVVVAELTVTNLLRGVHKPVTAAQLREHGDGVHAVLAVQYAGGEGDEAVTRSDGHDLNISDIHRHRGKNRGTVIVLPRAS